MGQTLFFFLFVGLCGLIFCKIEGVSYVDGIYFIVVTTLTIGFGDVVPTTTAMKVLTFPIAILGISLLALIVTSILRLLDDHDRRQLFERRSQLRKEQAAKEKKIVEEVERINSESPDVKPPLSLQEELQSLRDKDWKRERRSNLRNMVIGLTVFLLFWYIGALIFHLVEVFLQYHAHTDCSLGVMEMPFISVTCIPSTIDY
jgi:potassium channel subfamily K, other eukaryote